MRGIRREKTKEYLPRLRSLFSIRYLENTMPRFDDLYIQRTEKIVQRLRMKYNRLRYPKTRKKMSTPMAPRFSISPYFAAYDPAKPTPVVTKTVERLISDAGQILSPKKSTFPSTFLFVFQVLLVFIKYPFFFFLVFSLSFHQWLVSLMI